MSDLVDRLSEADHLRARVTTRMLSILERLEADDVRGAIAIAEDTQELVGAARAAYQRALAEASELERGLVTERVLRAVAELQRNEGLLARTTARR